MTTDPRFASSPFQRTTKGRNGSVPFVETTSFLSGIRSLHTTLNRMSSFKAPDVCDKEEKVKATFSLLLSLLDDLKSGDLLPQEKTEALDFIKEQLDLLHRKDHSLRYSAELLIFSSILHTISPHAYRFIRGSGKISLPHQSVRSCELTRNIT
ncbi:hypothetical protein HPB51_022963 [Rhipicephalus microplus]|uniref:THAP9-like helix-turn-helix domain-containing protein n=1 Tax=Rhipicephalus microplus TaxID=6941 RepID=A0A9J6DDE0_RHIMP|nr:hypothetical protein HPB51_022963 [Rhipicephalus microplus]